MTHIKQYLALAREEMLNPVLISNGQPISKTEARIPLPERTAHLNMAKTTQAHGSEDEAAHRPVRQRSHPHAGHVIRRLSTVYVHPVPTLIEDKATLNSNKKLLN
ncbi:hypothetical protein ON010_g13380 [Phytophthora cinnamomi]|nr:hypothetical protein ON010_g13380 [Phytophthora cinnamomi]